MYIAHGMLSLAGTALKFAFSKYVQKFPMRLKAHRNINFYKYC